MYVASIDGINWVMAKVAETGRPSVVSNSTGSGFSKAKNDAVDRASLISMINCPALTVSLLQLTAAGIHFVVSSVVGSTYDVVSSNFLADSSF